jgi:hypothetical protein
MHSPNRRIVVAKDIAMTVVSVEARLLTVAWAGNANLIAVYRQFNLFSRYLRR